MSKWVTMAHQTHFIKISFINIFLYGSDVKDNKKIKIYG